MIFFSGFSLQNESELFVEYLGDVRDNPYVVAGFSYGAIRALEYTLQAGHRIDRLILLSPAWFCNKSRAFIKTQLIYYKKDPEAYIANFLKNVAYPTHIDLQPYRGDSNVSELETLLTYPWSEEKFHTIAKRKIEIETYLGGKDHILDAYEAYEFFKKVSTCYLFKPFGHLLQA